MRKFSKRVSPRGSGENFIRYCYYSVNFRVSTLKCDVVLPDYFIIIGDWLIWCHHPSAGCSWSNGNTLQEHRDIFKEGEILETSNICSKQVWPHPHLGHGKEFTTCSSLVTDLTGGDHNRLFSIVLNCVTDSLSPFNFEPETLGSCFVPRVPHSCFPCQPHQLIWQGLSHPAAQAIWQGKHVTLKTTKYLVSLMNSMIQKQPPIPQLFAFMSLLLLLSPWNELISNRTISLLFNLDI